MGKQNGKTAKDYLVVGTRYMNYTDSQGVTLDGAECGIYKEPDADGSHVDVEQLGGRKYYACLRFGTLDEAEAFASEHFDKKEIHKHLDTDNLDKVSCCTLYSKPDENHIIHAEGMVYNIELSDDEADKIGGYHSDGINGQISYREMYDGRRELQVGVAGSYDNVSPYMCSWSPIDSGDFTKEQAKYAYDIVSEAIGKARGEEGFKIDSKCIANVPDKIVDRSIPEGTFGNIDVNGESKKIQLGD